MTTSKEECDYITNVLLKLTQGNNTIREFIELIGSFTINFPISYEIKGIIFKNGINLHYYKQCCRVNEHSFDIIVKISLLMEQQKFAELETFIDMINSQTE